MVTKHHTYAEQRVLSLALIASLILHFLFFVLMPHWHTSQPPKKIEFTIELQKKTEPPKAPTILPPEPVAKPKKVLEKILESKPLVKQPKPAIFAPADIKTPPPTAAPVPAETPHEVIAMTPKTDSKPATAVAAAPAEPIKSNEPSQEDINAARGRYGKLLNTFLNEHLEYPRIAISRNMQGTAYLTIEFDSNGKVLKCEIDESSGYDILDKRALDTVKKNGLPVPETLLLGRTFILKHQPMTFTLSP